MSDKHQAVRDEIVTAAGGVLGTGIGGALAGSQGAIVGGALGSVGALLAAKLSPEYFQNTVVHRYFGNRKIVALLKHKINADLDYTFLDTQADFDRAMDSMRFFLKAATIEDSSIGTLESRLARGFRWRIPNADATDQELIEQFVRLAMYCRTNGPIRVGCPAICPAVAAILRELHGRIVDKFGVELTVDCYGINGRTFFDSLQAECKIDFAVGPLEALVLSDPSRRIPLRIIGPVFGERQRIFVSTKKRPGIRSGVWVFSRSSAKCQYQVGIGVERNVEEQRFDDARQIPDLVESIPAGDSVIAWDPLSSVFDRRKDYAVVPHSDFRVHFVLLGHSNVLKKGRFPVNAFLTVLLAEWRRHKRMRDGLFQLLKRDHHFMKAFARGAGCQWTPEL